MRSLKAQLTEQQWNQCNYLLYCGRYIDSGAANGLLKFLEEQTKHSFILLTEQLNNYSISLPNYRGFNRDQGIQK